MRPFVALVGTAVMILAGCEASASPPVSPIPPVSDSASPSAEGKVVLAAGDIASCDSTADEATAALLDGLEGTILVLGDIAYPDGAAQDFASCYDPSWGRHRDRTRPVPGNHEYQTDGAAAYFDYFGADAGDPDEGWYAFDLGGWHVIALNSNCDEIGGCGPLSPQARWLEADLEGHPAHCTLAYWHHPRWSSGEEHGSDARTDTFWRLLSQAGADVVLTGHDHQYERFIPMNASGAATADGVTEFVVGTGGRSLYEFADVLPASAARDNSTHGILKLTLEPAGYAWEFVPATDGGFTDRGSASCR